MRKMKLSTFLEKKKFVLILDDMWSAMDLNTIGSVLSTSLQKKRFLEISSDIGRHVKCNGSQHLQCVESNLTMISLGKFLFCHNKNAIEKMLTHVHKG
jgi:hypothetical protein